MSRRVRACAFFVLPAVAAVVAFLVAPGAGADSSGASPGANLAGLNADAEATAMQFIPLARGLVPAGNLATGDFFQISVPYASASSQTGPASNAIAAPVYPGPVAASLPGALQTEGFPASLAELTADPVLAESSYPPEPGQGASATYSPPGGSTTGAGTASSSSADSGSIADAATSTTRLAGGQVVVGSSTTHSSTTIAASSVADSAETHITHVTMLGGLVDIASITSQSSTSSNGTTGTESSTLQVGAVTVAGQPAYIGPNGLQLAKTANNLLGAVSAFNSALTALQQAGLSITTIAPSSSVDGAAASVESGAVQIKFSDPNVPNPQGQVPVSLIGAEIDLGLTDADAQATQLPAIGTLPAQPTTPALISPAPAASSPASGGVQSITRTNSTSSDTGLSPATSVGRSSNTGPQVAAQPASFIGMPTRLAWIVIAVILSIVACGPLLGYANWQLLRGRKS